VTFDARLKSSWKSDLPNKLDLELSLDGTVFRATCNAENIGKSVWEDAQKLNPESLIRITGRIQPLAIDAESTRNHGQNKANGSIRYRLQRENL